MNPILTLLLGQLSERLVVALLLQILEQLKPLVAQSHTQLDDMTLDALVAALKRAQEEASYGRPGNRGTL